MISNKTLTIAAVAFATANGLSVQSKLNAQAQAEAEAQFLDAVGDAFEDAWDWTKGAGESAWKWSKQAAYDIGDAFKDMGEWMADPDNWENLGYAIIAPVYTPPFNCGGGAPTHEEMCLNYEPQPGELIPDDPTASPPFYNDWEETYTMNFNYQLESSGIPTKMIYGLFGDVNAPDYRMMRTSHCEAVDCLNPCYEDGSCFKCADAALESARETGDGVRILACDLCSVPVPKRGGRR